MKKAITRIDALLNTIDEQLKDIEEMTPDEIKYRSLLIGTEGLPVSKNMAIKIVGGRTRLLLLMEKGVIRYISEPATDDSANKKHLINLADCIRYTKPRVLKIRKTAVNASV